MDIHDIFMYILRIDEADSSYFVKFSVTNTLTELEGLLV